jgi:hypothetical protein
VAAATKVAVRRRRVAPEAGERDILSTVRRGLVKLDGGELRWALTCEPELLGVLADMHEQGLICCELRFRLTDEGRARLADLVADGRAGR